MSRHKLEPKERAILRRDRKNARIKILAEANRYRLTRGGDWFAGHWGLRRIQEAVHLVRQHQLVSDKLLLRAGFRPA
jgi:hypothetical protein